MRISRQLVPPNGWNYQQGDVLLEGKTWAELVTNVIAHRASNSLEIGNPEYDIESQLIQRNPNIEIGQFRMTVE